MLLNRMRREMRTAISCNRLRSRSAFYLNTLIDNRFMTVFIATKVEMPSAKNGAINFHALLIPRPFEIPSL